MRYWWLVHFTLTNGKEFGGYVMSFSKEEADNSIFEETADYIKIKIRDRKTICDPGQFYQIARPQVCIIKTKFLSEERI